MNTITCPHCGEPVEIDKALEGQIEAQVIASEHKKHLVELAKVRQDADERTARQLEGEKELLRQKAADELALEKRKIELSLTSSQKKIEAEQEALIATLKNDSENAKVDNKKLRDDLGKLMDQLRESNKAKDNAELEAKKTIAEEVGKIREEAEKSADEKQRLRLAEKDSQLNNAKKQLEEMQRKLNQGSQQSQGEILELDLELALAQHFREDDIVPVAKGVNGADITHIVKSQSGIECGVILWEIKRTKNWVADWTGKLKTDLRNAKANIPVIISEVVPKDMEGDMGQVDGVWVVKPKLAIILATLLRKSLLDVGRQKALAANQGDKASALYSFATSHEFAQQIESMVETYQDMRMQVTKERVVFEKQWAQREKQADKLLMGTANVIGSIQGHIGVASMPRIKGLELDMGDDEPDSTSEQSSLL